MSSTSERLLGELAVFAGHELGELPDHMPAVELADGEELCRQGQPADALYVVEHGSVVVAARLPGEREVELAALGPGDVVGELALLDRGARTATVRAVGPTRVLRVDRVEFQALVSRPDAGARALRRKLIVLAATRLAERHRALASSLGPPPPCPAGAPSEAAGPPDRDYLRRLPFFSDHGPGALDKVLARARFERVRPGAVLVAEGETARGLLVTVNGAVQEALRGDGSAIRVALAGPGRGFGYAGLLAGGRVTAAAVARERATVLVVEPGPLEELLAVDAFAAAVERDLVHALRQAERPQARLAAAL